VSAAAQSAHGGRNVRVRERACDYAEEEDEGEEAVTAAMTTREEEGEGMMFIPQLGDLGD